MSRKIKIAIIGVGNCAVSLVEGIEHYRNNRSNESPDLGLMHPELGGYRPEDIEVVAAFDVTADKVGKPLSEALYSFPNNANSINTGDTLVGGPRVERGPTLDGLGRYLRENVAESDAPEVPIYNVLKDSGAELVVNYLPVGSDRAAELYASAALNAGCSFINCMPAFIASRKEWADAFTEAGLPIVGDDVKSQFGATIVHRVLAALMHDRGVTLDRTMQLNVGGNADFLNMLERDRLKSKKISKTQAVTSVAGIELAADDVHIGPSDHVPWLRDRKWAHIHLEGRGFGGAPIRLDVKLEVEDSPNSAGVVIDAIRYAAVAKDRGIGGPLHAACSYLMKSPPQQIEDFSAQELLEEWLVNG